MIRIVVLSIIVVIIFVFGRIYFENSDSNKDKVANLQRDFNICKILPFLCSKDVDYKDLIQKNGLFFEKFSEDPFSGTSSGLIKGHIKNGMWEGEISQFSWSGEFLGKVTLKNNKFIKGRAIFYDDKFNIIEIANYNNGLLNGKKKWFFKDGCLSGSGNYLNGLEDGEFISYSSCFKLDKQTTYTLGVMRNHKVYISSGLLLEQRYDENGKLICINDKYYNECE